MVSFTNYEAEKFFSQNDKNIIKEKLNNLEDSFEAWELSKILDISESTANNWLAGRGEISNLGEQAISYHLLQDLINVQKRNLKSNILVNNNNLFEIYRKTDNGYYELLATTKDLRLARTIQKLHNVYDALSYSAEFIKQEIDTLHDCDIECQYYMTQLRNIQDLIRYINKGETFSQKLEQKFDELNEMDKAYNEKLQNSSEKNETFQDNSNIYVQLDDKKLYDDTIPNEALIKYEPQRTNDWKYRGICLYVKKIKNNCYQTEKVTRFGKLWEDYKDYFGENNIGKKYPSLLSAIKALLYTRSKSVNTTEETEYSLDGGKNWRSISYLKMTDAEHQQFLSNNK